jgi:6-phosphofructo-2-kinase / fructose-2,6-biphosphatase 2
MAKPAKPTVVTAEPSKSTNVNAQQFKPDVASVSLGRLMYPYRKTDVVGIKADDTRICVVMVGLPARGKSYIAQKRKLIWVTIHMDCLARHSRNDTNSSVMHYLRWLSIRAKTFNVGSYRRQQTAHPPADFFDTSNTEGERLRKAAAEAAVNDMLRWFKKDAGVIAILDATNSTKKRRSWIYDKCTEAKVDCLFVESICYEEAIVMANIVEVKTSSPDYTGQDPQEAIADFLDRIKKYEEVYQTIDPKEEKHLTYVKLIDVGQQVIINLMKDYLQSRVVYYLMNLHIRPRSIWLSRVRYPPFDDQN